MKMLKLGEYFPDKMNIIFLLVFSISAFFLNSCAGEITDPVDINTNGLEYIIPETAGYSSAKLDEAKEFANTSGFDAVMVLYDGKVIFSWGEITENYWLHSIRKPMLSSLYGIHVNNGNINLDATLDDLNIDDIPPGLTEAEKQAAIRDLITSTSGVYHIAAAELSGVGWIENRPKRGSHAPGTFFWYNNWDFNAAGTIFEQETGTKIFEEFKRKIADPIGMEDFAIENCIYQYEYDRSEHPAYHFRMSCRDLARFGALYQKNGVWNNEQIVPRGWIQESTMAHSIEDSTYGTGYGYMWKIYPKGSLASQMFGGYKIYGHTGLGGVQTLMVIPELKLVIVERTNTDAPYVDKELGLELGLMILNARL
jgi:CubicO group peptidase (beta-lactamase class C family)